MEGCRLTLVVGAAEDEMLPAPAAAIVVAGVWHVADRAAQALSGGAALAVRVEQQHLQSQACSALVVSDCMYQGWCSLLRVIVPSTAAGPV